MRISSRSLFSISSCRFRTSASRATVLLSTRTFAWASCKSFSHCSRWAVISAFSPPSCLGCTRISNFIRSSMACRTNSLVVSSSTNSNGSKNMMGCSCRPLMSCSACLPRFRCLSRWTVSSLKYILRKWLSWELSSVLVCSSILIMPVASLTMGMEDWLFKFIIEDIVKPTTRHTISQSG